MLWVRAGSLFALEVLHRAGMQFYEMATFAVLAGEGYRCLCKRPSCRKAHEQHQPRTHLLTYQVIDIVDRLRHQLGVHAAGLVCLLIFRGLAGIPYGPIWDWEQYISAVDYRHILLGEHPLSKFRPNTATPPSKAYLAGFLPL